MRIILPFFILATVLSFVYADEPEKQKEYTVTASLTPVEKSAVGSAVTIFTADDLERRGLIFLPDILREVPGLAVNRNGGYGMFTQIRARGAEANHTLVLINGVEVNDPAFGEYQFANLTADNIERVEILRGAQSALWGSDAIGAVINIITKKGQGPAQLNATFTGGSFATQHTTLGTSYGNELLNMNFSAEVLATNGTNIARSGDEDDSHYNRVYDLNLGFTPAAAIEFSYTHRIVKAVTQTDSSSFVDGVLVVKDAAGNQTNSDHFYQRGSAKFSLFEGHWTNTVAYQRSKNRADFQSNARASFLDGDKQKYTVQSNLALNSQRLVNARHDFSLLYDYEDDNATGSFIGGKSQVGIITRSYVGEYRLALANSLFLSTGIRRDDTDEFFKDAMTYRVTGAYRLPGFDSRLHASYGTGVKNPTISEVFGNFPNFTGNPNLKPERSRGWDAGFEKSLFQDRLTLDLTYFRNLIEDQIEGSNKTARNRPGTSSIHGLEVTLQYSPFDALDVNGGYTFTRANNSSNQELVRRPKHIANVNLNYRFFYDRANINVGLLHTGRQQDTVFVLFPARPFRTRLGAYTLVNVATSYEYSDYLSFNARIENLLDEAYEEVFSYTNPGIAGFVGVNLALNP